MARVLFVDDDPFTLETLSKAIQIFGHEPLRAGTGEQALTIIQQEQPDLVFVDMALPDMDGLDLLKTLHHQEATANIPVLMLSAGPELDAGERARAAGARAYINKPVRLQDLLDLIKEYTAK